MTLIMELAIPFAPINQVISQYGLLSRELPLDKKISLSGNQWPRLVCLSLGYSVGFTIRF